MSFPNCTNGKIIFFSLVHEIDEKYFIYIEHLKMFFAFLQGNNDNPTVTQFTSALRKLLVHNEIRSSDLSNCADGLKILTVSSRRKEQVNRSNIFLPTVEYEEQYEEFLVPDIDANDMLLDCCEEITIAHMAGLLESKILQSGRFDCSCSDVLLLNEKVRKIL